MRHFGGLRTVGAQRRGAPGHPLSSGTLIWSHWTLRQRPRPTLPQHLTTIRISCFALRSSRPFGIGCCAPPACWRRRAQVRTGAVWHWVHAPVRSASEADAARRARASGPPPTRAPHPTSRVRRAWTGAAGPSQVALCAAHRRVRGCARSQRARGAVRQARAARGCARGCARPAAGVPSGRTTQPWRVSAVLPGGWRCPRSGSHARGDQRA